MNKIREAIDFVLGTKRKRNKLGGVIFYLSHIFFILIFYISLIIPGIGFLQAGEDLSFTFFTVLGISFTAIAVVIIILYGFLFFLSARKNHPTKNPRELSHYCF